MPKNANGKWVNLTSSEVTATTKGPPVEGFDIEFEWHTGPWEQIFDRQVKLIQGDVARARAEDKLIVYLSCPISSRGGGNSGANVDIAKFTERALLQRWGEGFWILNPAQYQLESKAGTGLISNHAQDLGIDLDELRRLSNPEGGNSVPGGGDYMRMWTRVLVEDQPPLGSEAPDAALAFTGEHFDAFYFLGPRDVQAFFAHDGSLTSGIQSYFASKFATDSDFRNSFSVPNIVWEPSPPTTHAQSDLRAKWERVRLEFLRYYGLRASGNFSLGSHDEWNIFVRINQKRRAATVRAGQLDGNVSTQLAGFFDGGQLDPGSTEMRISRGYAI
jgi:hypothetical protein